MEIEKRIVIQFCGAGELSISKKTKSLALPGNPNASTSRFDQEADLLVTSCCKLAGWSWS
jgi:hypothetical protein